jgi:hypothetical protein
LKLFASLFEIPLQEILLKGIGTAVPQCLFLHPDFLCSLIQQVLFVFKFELVLPLKKPINLCDLLQLYGGKVARFTQEVLTFLFLPLHAYLSLFDLVGELVFLVQEGSEGLVDLFDGGLIRSGDVAIDSGNLLLHLAEVVRDLADGLSLLLYPLTALLLPRLARQRVLQLLLPH